MTSDKKPSKILFVYGGAKNRGGIHSYLANLFQGFRAEFGVDLALFSVGDWALTKELEADGFAVAKLNKPTWHLAHLKHLLATLKEGGYDLMVSQGMMANFYARVATLLTKVPNVVIVHSDWRWDYRGAKRVTFWLLDRLLRFATKRYITVSEYLKTELIKEGIRPKKITVVLNGVKIKDAGPDNKMADGIIIGSVGRLHPVKNHKELIRAVAEIEGVELEIVGDGAERGALEKLITTLGVRDRVRLIGQVSDVAPHHKRWSLYVQPSICEGFGLAAAEAMLAGLPVVVTPGGALPEIVKDGETGFVCAGFYSGAIKKTIEEALTDKNLGQIAAAGQSMAQEKFSEKNWLKEMKKSLTREKI